MNRHVAVVAALVMPMVPGVAAAQVTTLRNLAFGIVPTGISTSVSKTSANSAQWRFVGTFVLGGSFSLTLPTSLAGPGTPIPITFSTSDGQRSTTNNPLTGSSFNPHVSQSVPISIARTEYVWLGASVLPAVGQTPGAYTATVVLTTAGML